MRVHDGSIEAEIRAIRAELAAIAQAYGAAGMAILNALHPGGYARHGRMPESTVDLRRAKALLKRLAELERLEGEN